VQDFLSWFGTDPNGLVMIGACLAAAFLGGAMAAAIILPYRRVMNDRKATDEDRAVATLNITQGYLAALVSVASVAGCVVFSVLLAVIKAGLMAVK
jgi:hypothetical protein